MKMSGSQKYLNRHAALEDAETSGDAESRSAPIARTAFQLPPEDAAEYIAEILISLRAIAVKAELEILSDLIEVAGEEARMHSRP